MKSKLFRKCSYFSTFLLLGFIGLYVYILACTPNSNEWTSVSIGHGKVSIAHSRQPSTRTNDPSMLTYPEDGGGNFHFAIARDFSKEMGGCYLYFLNQNMPEEGMMTFAALGDTITNRTCFHGAGIEFFSGRHTARMFGFSDGDRESETQFKGYGIYFRDTSHTIDKAHNWWTLMISLWYPIIFFGILPAIFVAKKLNSTHHDHQL